MPHWHVREQLDGVHKTQPLRNNKKLVGANGGQIELNDAVFLYLTVSHNTSSQMVYVTP